MNLGVHEILCIVTIIQLLLFSGFLFTQNKGRRLSHVILAVFFLSKALGIFNHLVFRLNISSYWFYFALVPFSFLYGPFLYLYVKSLLDKSFSFKKSTFLHLLPFFLSAFYFMIHYYIQTAERKKQILNALREHISPNAILIVAILNLLIFGYVCLSFWTLRTHRKQLKDVYSSIDQARYRWLSFILIGFTLVWTLDVASFILRVAASSPLTLSSFIIILFFIFANVAIFKGLRESDVFNGDEELPRYHHSKLSRVESEHYLGRLLACMRSEKPYLEPTMTITRLGRRLSIPPRYLSQVINESLGINFYDFVNGYRVEEVKRLLSDKTNGNKNFLEILFEVGFNTKSAFNRAFKKHTGMTPSQFKRLQKSRSDSGASRLKLGRP